MSQRVLITGGAGFIGSHVADELLAAGRQVRVLDNLDPQVHGENQRWPEYLCDDVERIRGDVRDADTVAQALDNCDEVIHLAAKVGVGQSMYEVVGYTEANDLGTATLLEALIRRPVQRLVVASSMSVYGEGLYRTRVTRTRPRSDEQSHEHVARTLDQLRAGQWEPTAPSGQQLEPIPTPEAKRPNLTSVYALTKYAQERMSLLVGQAYHIPTVALRFFNIYGPRQALSNPYTGVLAIFASRLLNAKPPLIFEDGRQQRDFVSVHDVARACRLALEAPATAVATAGGVFNIGSGQRETIRQLAGELARVMNKPDIEPRVTGDYRVGDIRHCFADIALARRVLGYQPRVTLARGVAELARWLEGQAPVDRADEAREALLARGLSG